MQIWQHTGRTSLKKIGYTALHQLYCMASARVLPWNLEIVLLSEMIDQPLGIMMPDATIKIGEFAT